MPINVHSYVRYRCGWLWVNLSASNSVPCLYKKKSSKMMMWNVVVSSQFMFLMLDLSVTMIKDYMKSLCRLYQLRQWVIVSQGLYLVRRLSIQWCYNSLLFDLWSNVHEWQWRGHYRILSIPFLSFTLDPLFIIHKDDTVTSLNNSNR